VSEAKHAPGPWIYDSHGGCFYVWGKGHAMVADGDTEEGYITRMRGVGRGATVEEQEANARLIAAAPDLLREAQQALAFLEDLEASENPATEPESVQAPTFFMLLASLRDAIAKATEPGK
jgi:hypothetical protein